MNELTYTLQGDYLLPDLVLTNPVESTALGKYGRMRRSFLKEHRKISYTSLLLTEKLYPHLIETEEAANARMEQILVELTTQNPPPSKTSDQMGWIQHMNSLRAQAEEAILQEMIFI